MKKITAACHAFGVAAIATMLAACGGPTQVVSNPAGAERIPNRRAHPNNVSYLFVSDQGGAPGLGKVVVFNYPSPNTWAFTLNGLNTPAVECVDSSTGNVYVTDTAAQDVKEYSNSGILQQTLNDAGNSPVACAVKLSSYRVAVVNANGPSITVYSGTGTNPPSSTYATSLLTTAAYDSFRNGNQKLYIDGTFGGAFRLIKMNQNGNFSTVTTGGPPTAPGGVQQPPGYGYLAIGNASLNAVYHISFTGAVLPSQPPTNPNPTSLNGSCNSFGDFFIHLDAPHERVLLNPETCNSKVNAYKYPAGGPPGNSYSTNLVQPVGVVVSQ